MKQTVDALQTDTEKRQYNCQEIFCNVLWDTTYIVYTYAIDIFIIRNISTLMERATLMHTVIKTKDPDERSILMQM